MKLKEEDLSNSNKWDKVLAIKKQHTNKISMAKVQSKMDFLGKEYKLIRNKYICEMVKVVPLGGRFTN